MQGHGYAGSHFAPSPLPPFVVDLFKPCGLSATGGTDAVRLVMPEFLEDSGVGLISRCRCEMGSMGARLICDTSYDVRWMG
jgi:hypothetical protein